jgi:hypothetical protein
MLELWAVIHNLLWVMGLALSLAALSMAYYTSCVGQVRLRHRLTEFGFQLPFSIGMVLFCAGLLFSGHTSWEKVIWGLLGALFAGQTLRLWRHRRITGKER